MLNEKVLSLINKELPDFSFPHIEKMEINNKIKIYFIEDKTQPLISFKLIVRTGAINDFINGISYFVMQMLKRGTKKRNAFEIAEQIEQMGSSISFNANWHSSILSLITLPNKLNKTLEILSDCFFNSIFNQVEIDKLKVIHIADIEQEMADPNYLAKIIFNENMYANHPYCKPIIGSKQSIDRIQRDDCIKFYDDLISQPEYILIVAGNITQAEIKSLVNNYIDSGKFDSYKEEASNHIDLVENKQNRIIIKNKNDANQTTFRIGKQTIGRKHKDYPALQFVNTILGSYFNSRLNKILREELGYTYGVHSMINSRRLASTLEISTGVKKEASRDTVSRIIDELNNLIEKPVSDNEFFTAKQYILGSFVRSLETPQQISSMIYNLVANDLDFEYYNNFYKSISQLIIDDLFEIQKKYFKPENILITAIGDEQLLAKELKDFGLIKIEE